MLPSGLPRGKPWRVAMRILILNQAFHPDVVATAQIATDLARELVRRGHSVTAIASSSLYGAKGRALPAEENVDGITIRRVAPSRFGRGKTVGRIADFGAYFVRSFAAALTEGRFDLIVVLTTPPFLVLAALLLRRLRGSRVLYWVMDVYPDVMVAEGMIAEDDALARSLRWLHRAAIGASDLTVALGRCMRDRLAAQGAPRDRIDVLPVWSPAEPIPPTPRNENFYRRRWNVGDRMLVMYSGNFGLAHDVETFLHAAEALKHDDRIRFAFVGAGARKPDVDRFVRARGLSNCVVEDLQPREALGALLAAADVHLVTMEPRMEGLVVPSKFYGAVAAGRACIFVGPEGSEVARNIAEWGCGATVSPGDVEGLVSALEELAAVPSRAHALGEQGRRALEAEGLVLRKAGPLADRIERLLRREEPA